MSILILKLFIETTHILNMFIIFLPLIICFVTYKMYQGNTMNLLIMLISFIAACTVIIICLSKRQMKIARACFLAFGIAIGTCSAFIIYIDSQLSDIAIYAQTMVELRAVTGTLLGMSAVIFDIIAVIVSIATVILSISAIKKIAEYIKGKKQNNNDLNSEIQKVSEETTCVCARKIFAIHCRRNN